jgi:hypothetical protein
MASKSVPPSIRETAFDCPHCGAYAAQNWYALRSNDLFGPNRTPQIDYKEIYKRVQAAKEIAQGAKIPYLKNLEKRLAGLVCLDTERKNTNSFDVYNLHLSKCFNCNDFAVWVHNKLLFPESRQGPAPNPDMPDDVKADYEEASKILNLSPRGAAALLRLAIQKLCVELKEKGENINDDIKSLVTKGLSPTVQKALDSVRVIGNEAVHPGTLDLKMTLTLLANSSEW